MTREAHLEELFAEGVEDTLDRSPYGDWRAIADADAVSLSFGFPGPETFPIAPLRKAAKAAVEPDALQYGTDEHTDHLESFVIDRERIDTDRYELTLTNGATHGIDTICRTFLDPGDLVAIEAPTFMGALGVFRNFGTDICSVPVDEHGLDVEQLAEMLARRDRNGRALPTLLSTIPSFQNPTGTTQPRDRRERLLDLAAAYEFVILEDDAYGELRYDGESVPSLLRLDDTGRVVRVGTFSKTIAPGIRLGWVIGPETAIEAVETLAAGGSNTFTRSLAGRYCAAGQYEETVRRLRAVYQTRRDRLLDCLSAQMPPGTDWTEPDGGFFTWVELPDGIDTQTLLEDAIDNGVTYLPGSMFYDGDGPDNCLRLSWSYATAEQIETGVDALAETVEKRLTEHDS